MKFNWEIKLGDVLQVALIFIALFGAWISLENWKVATQDKIDQLVINQAKDEITRDAVFKEVNAINTRLSRIEGKLNVAVLNQEGSR